MNAAEALIQGILQGLTEFLPVSSSGHISLIRHFMGITEGGMLFSVMLHIATLVSVLVAFFPRIRELFFEFFRMIRDIFTGKFSYKNANPVRKMLLMMIISLVPLWAVYPFTDYISSLAEDADIIVEGVCFIYTAVLMLIADRSARRTTEPLKQAGPGRALFIGCLQAIAVFPGISRSGSTIGAGLISGVDREYMTEYSFILSMPVILAAGITETGDAIKEGVTIGVLPLAVGMISAAVVGFAAIKLLSMMIKNNKLWIFSVYLFLIGGFSVVSGICGL